MASKVYIYCVCVLCSTHTRCLYMCLFCVCVVSMYTCVCVMYAPISPQVWHNTLLSPAVIQEVVRHSDSVPHTSHVTSPLCKINRERFFFISPLLILLPQKYNHSKYTQTVYMSVFVCVSSVWVDEGIGVFVLGSTALFRPSPSCS